MELSQKLKTELLNDPAIPLLGTEPAKTLLQRDTWTPMFTAALLTLAKTWKPPRCPSTGERIKKMWCIYTRECYSAIIKNETRPSALTWMDLEITALHELSQTEKDKHHMISLLFEI